MQDIRNPAVVTALFAFLLALPPTVPAVDKYQENVAFQVDTEVFATRGDTVLTFAEVKAAVNKIPENKRQQFLSDHDRLTRMVTNLLMQKHMALASQDASYFNESEIQARMLLVVWEELSKIFQNQYVQRNMLDDYTARAKELYLQEPSRFRESDKVTFQHILIRGDPDDEQLMNKASQAVSKLDKGKDFSELALEISEDESVKANQGMLKDTPVNQLEEQFRNGIRDIEPGELEIVASAYGVHIVKVIQRTLGIVKPFEAVQTSLVERARSEHRAKLLERFLSEFNAEPLSMPEGAVKEFLEQYNVTWQ